MRGEARRHVLDLDHEKLRAATCVKILLEALEAAYPAGPLKKLPRRYRALFKDVRYDGGPLAPVLSQFERAKAELEAADKDTKVSDGIMGFFALDMIGLSPSEEAHVFGLSGCSMAYMMLKPILLDLYPH